MPGHGISHDHNSLRRVLASSLLQVSCVSMLIYDTEMEKRVFGLSQDTLEALKSQDDSIAQAAFEMRLPSMSLPHIILIARYMTNQHWRPFLCEVQYTPLIIFPH